MNVGFPRAFDTSGHQEHDSGAGGGPALRVRILGGVVVLAVSAGLLWHFLGGGAEVRHPPPPTVIVARAVTKTVAVTEHAVGTVVANSTVQLTARVSGQLVNAGFTEGQIVHKGDLLFQIDPKPYQAALEQAKGQLAKDRAQAVSAARDRQRYVALFATHATSSQQRDQAVAAAQALAATVVSDRAAVELAELNLGYTSIRSPIDGKTGPILIQPGNLVSANGANPLVVITQIQPVKVSFSLPQSDLPRIQERQRARSLLAVLDQQGAGGAPLSAPVDFVSNQVSGLTGTIELRATFDNQDHQLVPGQMVGVDVTLGTLANAVVIPREGVNDGPTGRYAFVVSPDGVAEMRPLTVLFDDGTNVAVTDIKRGEKVIIDGQLRVLPGAKVKVAGAARRGGQSRTAKPQ